MGSTSLDWNGDLAAKAVFVKNGPIMNAYAANNWQAGRLGFPKADAIDMFGGGKRQAFGAVRHGAKASQSSSYASCGAYG